MTGRAMLNPHSVDRLRKLCGMLGSQHDGERATAAAKADAFVRSLGLSWGDVIGVPIVPEHSPRIRSWRAEPDWRDLLAFCASRMNCLNIREREFLRSIAQWRGNLTERQHQWLEAIADKLRSI
jgi:hypothetical protein